MTLSYTMAKYVKIARAMDKTPYSTNIRNELPQTDLHYLYPTRGLEIDRTALVVKRTAIRHGVEDKNQGILLM